MRLGIVNVDPGDPGAVSDMREALAGEIADTRAERGSVETLQRLEQGRADREDAGVEAIEYIDALADRDDGVAAGLDPRDVLHVDRFLFEQPVDAEGEAALGADGGEATVQGRIDQMVAHREQRLAALCRCLRGENRHAVGLAVIGRHDRLDRHRPVARGEAGGDGVGAIAEHDDHAADARRGKTGDGVFEQGLARHHAKRLVGGQRPQPAAFAGCEQDRSVDHAAMNSSTASWARSSVICLRGCLQK